MRQTIFKKTGFLLIVILFIAVTVFAQNRRADRVHALKIAFITEKVNLSSSQSERFWPVYNKYEDDLIDLRQDFLKEYRKQNNRANISERDAREYIEANLDYQDALVDLKRRYKNEFLKIISAQQLTDLYIAEREFRQMLIQKLRERRGRR